MRILIADDEALIRMGLRTMLQEIGHTVVGAAADGATALRLACETRPDLAILDIKMPEMDGLSVAEVIAERCPLPVLMLTAYSERDLVERATATESVQAYLVKPIREAHLAPAIEMAVSRFKEWETLRQEAADLQEALVAREIVAQAKQTLMQRDKLSEYEAFLEIQGRARRQRRTMRQVAERILMGCISFLGKKRDNRELRRMQAAMNGRAQGGVDVRSPGAKKGQVDEGSGKAD